jgi:anionic cell wall polymer biosynthesis LytR-Cps2A-Psr (LCP) family protein
MGIRDILLDPQKPDSIRSGVYIVLGVIAGVLILYGVYLFIRTSSPPSVAVDLPLIQVTVEGEVNKPGMYELPEGSTVFDAIYAAGGITYRGFLEGVDIDAVLDEDARVTVGEKPFEMVQSEESAAVPFVPFEEDQLTTGLEEKDVTTTNILYVGIPNVFIYLIIDPDSRTMSLCHIPPDTRVGLPTVHRVRYPGKDAMGMDRLKELYLFGGVELTLQKMKELLNHPPVDYYFVGDRNNFTKVVDIMGGIPLVLDERTAEFIGVEPGPQVLNGVQCWEYIRFLGSILNTRELDRYNRQREFIKSAYDRFQRSNLVTISKVAKVLVFESENNFSLKAMLDLAKAIRGVSGWKLHSYMIPGERVKYGTQFYWEVDMSETAQFVNRFLTAY